MKKKKINNKCVYSLKNDILCFLLCVFVGGVFAVLFNIELFIFIGLIVGFFLNDLCFSNRLYCSEDNSIVRVYVISYKVTDSYYDDRTCNYYPYSFRQYYAICRECGANVQCEQLAKLNLKTRDKSLKKLLKSLGK